IEAEFFFRTEPAHDDSSYEIICAVNALASQAHHACAGQGIPTVPVTGNSVFPGNSSFHGKPSLLRAIAGSTLLASFDLNPPRRVTPDKVVGHLPGTAALSRPDAAAPFISCNSALAQFLLF